MKFTNETISPAGTPASSLGARPIDATHDTLIVPGIMAERWPTVARAMGRYEQNVAEGFSRMAYDCVEAGIIRYDDRQRLSQSATELGIKPFDAQLLIACAIRQWALDRRYDASPSHKAPALSFEYRSYARMWVRFALVGCTAVLLDAIILWKWLY